MTSPQVGVIATDQLPTAVDEARHREQLRVAVIEQPPRAHGDVDQRALRRGDGRFAPESGDQRLAPLDDRTRPGRSLVDRVQRANLHLTLSACTGAGWAIVGIALCERAIANQRAGMDARLVVLLTTWWARLRRWLWCGDNDNAIVEHNRMRLTGDEDTPTSVRVPSAASPSFCISQATSPSRCCCSTRRRDDSPYRCSVRSACAARGGVSIRRVSASFLRSRLHRPPPDGLEHLGLPVLVGVLPQVSYKTAEFLHNERSEALDGRPAPVVWLSDPHVCVSRDAWRSKGNADGAPRLHAG